MDKAITKRLVEPTGIKQADCRVLTRAEFLSDPETVTKELIAHFGEFPLFVKPARTGSSVGISKAKDEMSLAAGLALAAAEDDKILVERAIKGRELEVAVLGNLDPVASVAGEILPAAEFYDYNAKYVDGTTGLVVPAVMPEDKLKELQDAAVTVYKAMGARGLARVDFFMEEDGTIVFNEINTLPGFTPISMYPKLFDHMGICYGALLNFLVELAMARDV